MSDTPQNVSPAAPVEPRHPRLARIRIALGMLPEPDGSPPYIWLERWDAFIVAACLAIGVPLLGLSGFATMTKLQVVAVWFALWPPFFFYFEGREVIGQMQGRGSIDPEQASRQQNTAQEPFWGVIIAVLVWAVAFAIQTTINAYPKYDGSLTRLFFVTIPHEWLSGAWTSWIRFGFIECAILVHAWLVTRYTNYIIYNVINTFLKATPMGERIERRLHP